MKRFFFDEEDDDNDDEMMDEAHRMMPEFIPEFLAMSGQENPAHHILNCSIRICEKSLFWKFIGLDRKMRMIERVFSDLSQLTEPTPKPEGN